MRLAHTLSIALVGLAAALAQADPLPTDPRIPSQLNPEFVAAGDRTLHEVLGVLTRPNHSTHIFSGERRDSTSMDLLFQGGLLLDPGVDFSSLNLTLLQRGQHTHFLLQGLYPNGLLSQPLFLPRAMTSNPGWSLDSIQLRGLHAPVSSGITLASSWSGLAGFRLTALGNVQRPDLDPFVSVPSPAGLVPFALAAAWGVQRSRRSSTLPTSNDHR